MGDARFEASEPSNLVVEKEEVTLRPCETRQ